MKRIIMIIATIIAMGSSASAQLEVVAELDQVINGVTTSIDGRIFVCFPHLEGGSGMRIGELLGKDKVIPYPNAAWNSWKTGEPTGQKIIRANSLRIGPDGNLWIVDTGSPSLGANPLPGSAAKLIVVSLKMNEVIRTIPLSGLAKPDSFFDDLRISGDHIFITDAGAPGIIVLSLKTGAGRRLLEDHPLAIDTRPLYAEGQQMKTQDGALLKINADQLEISPDGKWFYFQPVSGPMARIETSYLTDVKLSPKLISQKVEIFFKSPTTGGTCMDSEGNIYLSDVNKKEILKIDVNGKSTVLLKDSRLIWCDAMWLDDKGYLYLPCGQINRLPAFQNGKNKVLKPVFIYKVKTKSKPLRT